jgi:hypothetical protein
MYFILDRAARDSLEAGHAVEQRAPAATGPADDAEELAFAERDVHAVKDVHVALLCRRRS